MTHTIRTRILRSLAAAVTLGALGALGLGPLGSVPLLQAQSSATTALATVRLTQAVRADGKPLPAGTYQVRLTTTALPPVVGQSPSESRWVEFVQRESVVGRAVATVISADDMREIAASPMKAGTVRIEMLAGGDYLRLWLRHDGSHYLIHLPIAGR